MVSNRMKFHCRLTLMVNCWGGVEQCSSLFDCTVLMGFLAVITEDASALWLGSRHVEQSEDPVLACSLKVSGKAACGSMAVHSNSES